MTKLLYLINDEQVQEDAFLTDLINSSIETETDPFKVRELIELLSQNEPIVFNNKRYEIIKYNEVIN